jgi:hypothetical protein
VNRVGRDWSQVSMSFQRSRHLLFARFSTVGGACQGRGGEHEGGVCRSIRLRRGARYIYIHDNVA